MHTFLFTLEVAYIYKKFNITHHALSNILTKYFGPESHPITIPFFLYFKLHSKCFCNIQNKIAYRNYEFYDLGGTKQMVCVK